MRNAIRGLYARLFGYFDIPCPACRRRMFGFQRGLPYIIEHQDHHTAGGRMVCRRHRPGEVVMVRGHSFRVSA